MGPNDAMYIFYGTFCEMGSAYLIKTGSAFQLLLQHLHCMVD